MFNETLFDDGRAPAQGPVCFHCYREFDGNEIVDCAGEVFCSTLCATLMARFEHDENCCHRKDSPCRVIIDMPEAS